MSQLQSAVLDRISEIPPEIPLGPVYASGAARTTARRGPASDYTEPTGTSDNVGVGLPMELIHLRRLGMVFGSSRQPWRGDHNLASATSHSNSHRTSWYSGRACVWWRLLATRRAGAGHRRFL